MQIITAYDPKLHLQDMRLQLRALPREQPPWVDRMVVLADNVQHQESLRDCASTWKSSWNIVVHLTPRSEWWMPPYLSKYVDEDIGWKVLLPLWYQAPFLWMDGDILPTRDMSHIADETALWGSRMGHDKWITEGSKKRGDIRPSRLALAIERETGYLPETYCDAAVFFIPHVEAGITYIDELRTFFSIPEVAESKDKSWHEFRKGDQRFLSWWMGQRGARFVHGGTAATTWRTPENDKMSEDDPLYFAYADLNWKFQGASERFPNATLLHMSVSTNKPAAIKKYSDWLLPEGGFPAGRARSRGGSPAAEQG